MTSKLRERMAVALAALPIAFVLSLIMRAVAQPFHIDTPGWLFVQWFLAGYASRELIGGPASYYLILVDLAFCWLILVCLYWVVYRRFYDVGGGD